MELLLRAACDLVSRSTQVRNWACVFCEFIELVIMFSSLLRSDVQQSQLWTCLVAGTRNIESYQGYPLLVWQLLPPPSQMQTWLVVGWCTSRGERVSRISWASCLRCACPIVSISFWCFILSISVAQFGIDSILCEPWIFKQKPLLSGSLYRSRFGPLCSIHFQLVHWYTHQLVVS